MPNYFTRAFVAAAAILLSFSARADYPDRSIKIIVPIGAGSTTDYVARVIAETLRAAFKQPVVVENHAGAGGTLGTAVAARAPADGYTSMVWDFPVPGGPSTCRLLP